MIAEIKPVSIEEELKKSYLDYAMSVIIGRALPDARDGLKPVQRRILYAMYELKNDWNKPYKKSARVVGDVIGKYHPHGDAAVYDTLVRMAQDFTMRYPLIDGQGNFGSIDGDAPAAMRYTEVRLAKLAHELMADLEKDTVDFVPNYDNTLKEPAILPTKVPNLLVNGSSGIAVGMATNIPPHNLGEVIDALVAMIRNPEITIDEILELLPGPDFPTAGFICGRSGIKEAYFSGKGIIKLRARALIERDKHKTAIVITELPYQVNKARLVEKIAELAANKKIEGIADVRDESDREGLRVVIELKREKADLAPVVLNQLYKHTPLETSYGIILLALVNNRPQLLNIRELLGLFIEHRKTVVIRRTRYDLKKAEERAHILEGLKIALANLDEIIALIRAAKSPKEAKEGLMSRFKLSQIQAQAILDMRLQRLTGLERDKILAEYEEVLRNIAWYRQILSDESVLMKIIEDELLSIREEYADPRRTEIISDPGEIRVEDLIAEEDMVVTISHQGYIKRNPVSLYRSQRRGGRGVTGMETKEEDFVEHLFIASTHDYILFFSNIGRVYWLKVHEIPQAGRTARGKAIVNLLPLQSEERINAAIKIRSFDEKAYVVMSTRAGLIKKTPLEAFSNPRSGGIIAAKINPGDELMAAALTTGEKHIFVGTRQGQSIRFRESDVRPMGRQAAGVKAIDLAEGDYLVAMEILEPEETATILTVSENGFGKRTPAEEYRVQSRGGKGILTVRITAKNGPVAGILKVTEEDEIMLLSQTGKIIRIKASDIPIHGRAAQGVRLIFLQPGEKLVGVARVAEREE